MSPMSSETYGDTLTSLSERAAVCVSRPLPPGRRPAGLQDGGAIIGDHVFCQCVPIQTRVLVADLGTDLPVRGFYEAVLVGAGVGGHRPQQADVRPLRGLDGADPAVVRVMDVPDVEPGTLSGQASRPQRRQPPLVRQLRQGVGLVHELRELGAAEELPHRGHYRPYVDQSRRRGGRRVHLGGHALLDNAFHPHQADPHLVLDELTDSPHTPVAKVVYVIRFALPPIDEDHRTQQADHVLPRQRTVFGADVEVQAAVKLVSPHASQVVAPARVEEQVIKKVLGVVHARWLAGPQPTVELQQGLLLVIYLGVLLDSRLEVLVIGVYVDVLEKLHDLLVGRVPQRPEQHAHGALALAVHLDRYDVAVAGLELHPRAPVGDQLGGGQQAAGSCVRAGREVDARRTHELAHHHPLGAVDHEGPGRRHHRYVADEQVLEFPLPFGRTWRLGMQLYGDVQRGGVGGLTFAAFVFRVGRLFEPVSHEVQLEAPAGEVLDGSDLLEELLQAFRLEPLEGVELYLDKIGHVEYPWGPGVRVLGSVHTIRDSRSSRYHTLLCS